MSIELMVFFLWILSSILEISMTIYIQYIFIFIDIFLLLHQSMSRLSIWA